MTPEEYLAEETKLLAEVPSEFRSALSCMAYERGHAYGYSEALNILSDLVDNLKEPIEKYTQRMRLEPHDAAQSSVPRVMRGGSWPMSNKPVD